MATWKTRGLRGSAFESLINSTNEYYRKAGLALVQKIPTPITPLKFDSEKKLVCRIMNSYMITNCYSTIRRHRNRVSVHDANSSTHSLLLRLFAFSFCTWFPIRIMIGAGWNKVKRANVLALDPLPTSARCMALTKILYAMRRVFKSPNPLRGA